MDGNHDMLQFCQDAAIYADTGMELGEKDLHELFKMVVGTGLKELARKAKSERSPDGNCASIG